MHSEVVSREDGRRRIQVERQRIEPLRGIDYFKPMLPIYVNRVEESFDHGFHTHDFVEIAYVAEGKGYHHIGSQTLSVSKGDLFILPLGVPHVFRPSSARQRDLIVYNCLFREEMVASLPAELLSPEVKALVDSSRHPDWYQIIDLYGIFDGLFRELHYEYSRQAEEQMPMLLTLLIQLLIQIRRHRLAPHAPIADRSPLDDVLAFINANLCERLTLGELAQKARMSERHLHRLFKAYTGQSFTGYVQNARIERSRQLLASTSMKLSLVAEQVGYRDLDSFCRIFKRLAGHNPGAYRKLVRASK